LEMGTLWTICLAGLEVQSSDLSLPISWDYVKVWATSSQHLFFVTIILNGKMDQDLCQHHQYTTIKSLSAAEITRDLRLTSSRTLCATPVSQGQALGLVHHHIPDIKYICVWINGEQVLMSHKICGMSKGKMELWRLYEGHVDRHIFFLRV
jgi:hypothetical protein